MNCQLWMKRIRNLAGFLGMILPWLCLLGYTAVFQFGHYHLTDGFPDSMSITYYVSPVLAMILTTASIVLMTYDGYDIQDNIVTTISGVFGILIVLFPCGSSNNVFEAMGIIDVAGYFQTPVQFNSIVHNVSACAFFILLAYNSFFLFTKSDGVITEKKSQRNAVYRVCALGMCCAMILMPLPLPIPNKTFWVEAVALSFFGVSWLTKGGTFEFLND